MPTKKTKKLVPNTECPTCGKENPKEAIDCDVCGATCCESCHMGTNTRCMQCEGCDD